jgi:DNA-directed RNA polymerase specialized sigma24 family protein
MSPEKKRDFEAEWPLLARRLRLFLTRKRVPASQQDDLMQETALRLYKMWESVDRSRPAWQLTVTIALNLLRDEYRRADHSDVVADLPDIANNYDLERAGLARIELGRVRTALAEMSDAHRSVLLAEVGQHYDTSGPATDKMRRMRARRKLTQILERVSGVLLLPARRLNELGQALFGARDSLAAGASCLVCTVLGVGLAVSVPLTSQRANAETLGRAAGDRQVAMLVAQHSVTDDDAGSTSTDVPSAARAAGTRGSRALRAQDDGAAGSPLPTQVPLPTDPGGPTQIPPIPGAGDGDSAPEPPPPPPLPPLPGGGNGDGGGPTQGLGQLLRHLQNQPR